MESCRRKRIILVGDSITQQSFSARQQGWGAALSDWYCRYADVVNRGFSGYNSRMLKPLLPHIVKSQSIGFVLDSNFNTDILFCTIFVGANDAVSEGDSQHVPLKEYEENIISMVHYLRSIDPALPIILVTPPDVNNSRWPTRETSRVAMYADSIRSIGRDYSCDVLDLWRLPSPIVPKDLHDGLHFAASANEKFFDGLCALMRTHHPDICPDNDSRDMPKMQPHFPHWSEIIGRTKQEIEDMINQWVWR